MTISTGDLKLARLLKRNGIVNPLWTIQAAHKNGLQLPYACALLEKESGGGRNEFGHDPVRNPVIGGPVTKERYLLYRKYRRAGLGMQGVGPTQLTWYAYQDRADALGGCWKPLANMLVGFNLLADHIHRYGVEQGAAAYNGSGPAAERYGKDFVSKAARWKSIIEKGA